MWSTLFWAVLHYLDSLLQVNFFTPYPNNFKFEMRRVTRLRCYDYGGCYEGEWNRWPRDSLVWFRPLSYPYKVKGSIVRQEKNFLICDVDYVTYKEDSDYPAGRVKVHKREIIDILSAPHFHYGKIGERENFFMPTYPNYRSKIYFEFSTPDSVYKEE